MVAKIIKIERHPGAEKLYIETVDAGEGERQIVSGLVPHYKEEELLGKNIILVANLKPAKLRGVLSNGMLLAAESEGTVEVLFAPDAAPGTPVVLEGSEGPSAVLPAEIDIDRFFSIPLQVKDGLAMAGETPLSAGGREIRTRRVMNGKVG